MRIARLFARQARTGWTIAALLALMTPLAAPAANDAIEGAIARGRDNFLHNTFGGKGRVCDTCHLGGGLQAGRRPDGVAIASLANAAAIFPRIAEDGGTLITLSDQVRACVGGAVRGTPPAYGSDELNTLVAYVTSLSQGKPINMGGTPK